VTRGAIRSILAIITRQSDGQRHDLDAGARGREPNGREPRLLDHQRGLEVLRYGAFAPDVIDRLRGSGCRRPGVQGSDPASGRRRLRRSQPGRADGRRVPGRNRAASALLIKRSPEIAALDLPASERRRVLTFAASNEHLFLNVGMAACKAALDAAHGVPDSTIVTTMARNGTDFGIRVGGLGDRWFTGPAQTPEGLYFPGFSAGDANPDIGDSAITETAGLGGFAMGGAPAVVQFVGGTPADALEYTRLMYEITLGELGVPAARTRFSRDADGIDVRQSCRPDPADRHRRHREPESGRSAPASSAAARVLRSRVRGARAARGRRRDRRSSR
jgi:hypothetical protein